MDVILDAIQSGASRRVEAPTRRKDITPIAQEPDFVEQEDEPEVTLPEGNYDEMDFDDRRQDSGESAEEVSNEKGKDEESDDKKEKAEEETLTDNSSEENKESQA